MELKVATLEPCLQIVHLRTSFTQKRWFPRMHSGQQVWDT